MIAIPKVPGFDGKTVFVTGGAGFIGSSLVRVLLRSGARVVVYDNFSTGSRENLAGCAAEVGAPPTVIHGDVRDRERVARTLPGADVVFHLACLGVRHSIHSPFENLDVNAKGTLTVLDAARHARVARVVHVSTSEVYGTATRTPMAEDHPTDPHTVYGASKLDGECQARSYFRCYGTPTVVIRPFNAFGPRSHSEGDSGEVIPRFLVRALLGQAPIIFGDGSQTRDFCHVYDTARGLALAGVASGVVGATINIGTGLETTIRELAAIVLEEVGTGGLRPVEEEARPGDVLRLCAGIERARSLLGFSPQIPLRDGVGDLVSRFRALSVDELARAASAIVTKNWT